MYLLARCKHSSLLLLAYFYKNENASTSKLGLQKYQALSQKAPYCKYASLEFCTALWITTQFLSDMVPALGFRFLTFWRNTMILSSTVYRWTLHTALSSAKVKRKPLYMTAIYLFETSKKYYPVTQNHFQHELSS